MTRKQFEKVFLLQYDTLCRYANKKCPREGMDIVHQAYANIVEHHTYVRGALEHAKRWVFFKVMRELVRYRHVSHVRSRKLHEAGPYIIAGLQGNEEDARPDTVMERRECGGNKV